MGSPLRLAIAHLGRGGETAADQAWAAVTDTFERAEAAMSRFREASELTRLNRRAPEPTTISGDLRRALAAADRARRVTDGRFDPRIVDALERIGYAGAPQRGDGGRDAVSTGGDSATGADRGRSRFGRILDRSGRDGTVSLRVAIDLGGIGKGLALRWASRDLDRRLAATLGLSAVGYLLDAGGDITTSGSPDGTSRWAVGIEDPAGGTEPIAVVSMPDPGAIATSSVRRLRWQRDGRIVHHLIDPRTSEPGGEGLVAVTVGGADPAWAEVWSKALFLEGVRGIAQLARARGLAAWWATEDGRLEMTPAARLQTTWVAAES